MARKPIKRRKLNTVIKIICEGRTEYLYFEEIRQSLKGSDIKIDPKISDNSSCIGVVKFAEKNYSDLSDDIKVFCIFDKDKNTEKNYEKAIKIAKKNKFEIVLSNPCFEVWFFAHYCEVFKLISTSKLQDEMKKKLGENFKTSRHNYEKLKINTQKAINNAKFFAKRNENDNLDKFSEGGNPSSDIYKVIEYIQEKSKKQL